jgi:hypothetical protein
LETFESFERLIYTANDGTFDQIALQLFHFQANQNPVYTEYLSNLGVDPVGVTSVDQVPFLPISFFKTRDVRTGTWKEDVVFTSSGTTSSTTSKHVARREFYHSNAVKCFKHFFGDPAAYTFLALLPGYMDRPGSSLISMVDHFIRLSKRSGSGFYRDSKDGLIKAINDLKLHKTPAIVWGVTFALLDLAGRDPVDLSHCTVMETGGMKGMKAEITRDELQTILKQRFNIPKVCSEYGMTELMSQAYSHDEGHFACPPWMKIIIRDTEDPLGRLPAGRVGGINVIDLANIYSCAFVETQDLGRTVENGFFEVLGRLDNSDIRGCNLLG